ncbi:MAG: hypothetical protein ACO1SV_20230 [Fimbriimonas sp.]
MEPLENLPVDPTDLRVELRRFLAGIPFSHLRELSPQERSDLKRQALPYHIVGGLGAGLSVLFSFFLGTEAAPLWTLMIALGISAFLFCLYWVLPFWQALRKNQAYVYIGRMNDLVNFDVAQDHYRRTAPLEPYVNRYIELTAIGKGDRIWRLEGIPNDETLSGVRSMWLALVPDHDERGERPLTKEEVAELRIRAADFMRIPPMIVSGVAGAIAAMIVYRILEVVVPLLAFPISLVLWIAASYLVWTPYLRRWRFGKLLRGDMRVGKVRDGILASGLPWVVNGEPARWRVGRPKGGTNGVTMEQALELEASAREAARRAEAAAENPLPIVVRK